VVSVSPRVSVVVPMHNVAPYLGACLESLAKQTVADLEVIMVDDGSTDESGEIAERFAARDGRFRLVWQENAGLGAARNTGARHASGEFLAFVDSDDVVPRHAYELLLGALDETGSDFASGNVRRLTPLGTPKAGFLARAVERTRLRTHITRFPPLLLDRTAWNKLFRRSFWNRHGFRFPQGVYYEDIPVTLPAHYLARTVDVVDETVYLWRMREGDDLSITQRRTETKALRDRVAAVDHVSRFLADQGLWVSKALYDRSVLGADLRYFLDVLPIAGEEYRRLFLELANEFIDRVDEWALEQPLAIERLKWQLVRRRALPELLEALRFADEELGERPPVRVGRHWYGDYPFRTDERLGLPAQVFRLEDELAPVVRIDGLAWEGTRLRIEGTAYIGMLGAPRPDSQTVGLLVRRPGRLRRQVRIETQPVHRPDVTAESAQRFASLDWCGFVGELDAAELVRGRGADATWEIAVELRAEGLVRRTRRVEPAPLKAAPLAELSLPGGGRAWAGLTGRRLSVQAQRRPSAVSTFDVDDGVLQLDGEAGSFSRSAAALRVVRRLGGVSLDYPLSVARSEHRPFTGRVPLAELIGELDAGDEAAHVEEHGDGVVWDVFLSGNGGPRQLTTAESLPETTVRVGDREIVLGRARTGGFTVTERSARPVLTHVEWSAGGILRLAGTYQAPRAAYELVLSARGRPEKFAFALEHEAARGRFGCELAPGSVPSLAGERPLAEGLWDLLVRRQDAPAAAGTAVVLAEPLLSESPWSARIDGKPFHLGIVGDAPVLAVERDLEDDVRGGFAQRRLQSELYPSLGRERLSDTVVYLSFGGAAYADSPRALHEELVRRDAPLRHVWVVRDGAFRPPDTAEAVRHGSREYYELLAGARYVVTNDLWPKWFESRSGQTCLQTWHGAPVKRLGPALSERPKAVRAYRRFLAGRPDGPQLVVSPGPFATPILERAFPGADVIETGLPRTDVLLRPECERLRDEVKRRLGVEGKRVVLYAPTYRDDLEYRPGTRVSPLRDLPTYRSAVARLAGYRLGHLLDLEALASAIGDDHAVLFRKHHRVVEALPPEVDSLVRDVSGYPDALELLLATDVLVTDYSSLAFDFAASGRPILFFTPDLEAYRDDVRGFSLDFEAVAPGPLLHTTEDVIDALRNLDAAVAAERGRYESFLAAFGSLADGRASARVVEHVFAR
jgi:CDP-glycerol glycerophosphotransferase